ncbi:tectonic-like complex member MKS1 [Octopus bimaculoides]|uniref:Uncharacterized protein n=1 Tax=Octopus bimaculoides TaxID=37653 RepID=A0A0L8GMU4_OCTBM|nr:tectonic-like complex member MKS1 [Octopus bimaculoides]
MADLYDENDLGIAYYRTKDQLRNFKLRVCLKRITSNSFFHSGDEDDLDNERSNRVLASRDIEYKIFHWQEKVFSQREIMFYSQKDYCEGILSEKYHESVCKLLKEGAPRRRLFTYVNNDKFLPPQITEACTTSQKEQFTSLAKQVIALRERNKVRRRVK